MAKKKYLKKPIDSLDEIGRLHWSELCQTVKEEKGEVSDQDYYLIEKACIAHSVAAKAKANIDIEGVVYHAKNEDIRSNPATSILSTMMREYRGCLGEMLLTAKSNRLNARMDAEKDDASPLEKMMSGMK